METERPKTLVAESSGLTTLGRLLASLPDDLESFAAQASEIEDWDSLLAVAEEHDLVAVLGHALDAARVAVPPNHAPRIRHVSFIQRSRLHRVYDVLSEVVTALEKDEIRTVSLKGPILAERLFTDPFLRSSLDLDFLISERDLDRALSTLHACGYATEGGPTDDYNREFHHHLALIRPDRDFVIELHFRAFTGLGSSMPSDQLLDRSTSYRSRVDTIRVLSPEDELIYLVIHAVGHFVVRLKWLFDVHLLLRANPEIDWSVVADRTKALRLGTAFAFGLYDLERYLGVEIPALDQLSRPKARARVVEWLRSLSARFGSTGPLHTTARLLASAILTDSAGGAARFLAHHFSRVARRRTYRYFPRLIPSRWAG